MQILHSGRYAYSPLAVSASPLKSPISPFKPRELDQDDIKATIKDFAHTAKLAQSAGYDGVEIMGSEGYLINQFISRVTNKRSDAYGGSYENRTRLAREIVRAVRDAVGTDFIIIFRLSMLDCMRDGSTWEETTQLAKWLEADGVTILNTGIGWHEARVPTIATVVPRAGFSWVTAKMMGEVNVPLVATNRFNAPETIEAALAGGMCDMVSMARPLLADPEFVKKAAEDRADEINTCIACNQACLDHVFQKKTASCLVNPRACHETELVVRPTKVRRRIAIVGGGPAGMACAATAAERGHIVTLFESSAELGGQFNLAKRVPGKEEFYETIRYFKRQLELHNVDVRLNTPASVDGLTNDDDAFDEVILATGVTPRMPNLAGIDHPKVVSYLDAISGKVEVGPRVAIMGAGGIGFDLAEYLTGKDHAVHSSLNTDAFLKEWGIDGTNEAPGGMSPAGKQTPEDNVEIFLMQRKKGRVGGGLGKTTGWIKRTTLKDRKVTMMDHMTYLKIDDAGLHYTQGTTKDKSAKQSLMDKVRGRKAKEPEVDPASIKVLDVDHVVICAGQEPLRDLQRGLRAKGASLHIIGGAYKAAELDAKAAINQGFRLALEL